MQSLIISKPECCFYSSSKPLLPGNIKYTNSNMNIIIYLSYSPNMMITCSLCFIAKVQLTSSSFLLPRFHMHNCKKLINESEDYS
ncbi:hypothetical protein CARUB_v10002363mg [Capsella rubella]|uniref:Uncharacterized protein n=1 Tax=Capsella rubella TaxID=81985 RepID=R0FIL1_9BRAS|nr:hypothetical protein CARUB_v10002363mg [Capsella rubella]